MQKFLNINKYYYLIVILILATTFRFYGLNWDQNQHLHPDERFLTMVTQAIKWPSSIPEYFSTSTSPLNPHNQNFSFFVYGTFPLFLIKALSDITGLNDYNQITILGRIMSGLFDIFTILLVFLIGRRVFSSSVGLLAAFFYSVSVLPIQLSHFYAVDTFLNFFMALTTYLLIKSLYKPKSLLFILAGVSFGLAFASKISAFLIVPPVMLAFIYLIYKFKNKAILWGVFFFLATFLTFRIAQPYVFNDTSIIDVTLNPKFLANLHELKNLSQPNNYFPPAVMWNNTLPVLYPLKDLTIWGLGIPAGIITIIALLYSCIKIPFHRPFLINNLSKILLITIVLTIFIYQGVQFAKPLRYFYPMLPALMIISGYFVLEIIRNQSIRIKTIFITFLLIFWSVWPIAFLSIYSRPHSRVQASEWIYQNIPSGSSISAEHWDDALPLNLPGKSNGIYNFIEFPLYGQDTPEKWIEMEQKLKTVDYIILSSNRLYGGITRNPKMYPVTSKYYQSLFDGSAGFAKIAEFSSRPSIYIPGVNFCLTLPFPDYGKIAQKVQECNEEGLVLIDDYVNETDTVYDHPKVLIFKKMAQPTSLLQQ